MSFVEQRATLPDDAKKGLVFARLGYFWHHRWNLETWLRRGFPVNFDSEEKFCPEQANVFGRCK